MSKIRTIQIDQIGYDSQYYPRVNGQEDWLTVHRYKETLSTHPWKANVGEPGSFPPLVVVKTTAYEWPYILLDGLHRLRAFAAAGYDKVGVIVERIPQSKWLERSAELNIDSKRPLDSGDKRWVATKLKADGWEDGRIAKLLCMEEGSYAKLMSTGIQKLTKASSKKIKQGRSNRQVGNDNIGFLKSPFGDITGTANAQKALSEQSSVSSRDARQIVESFIALLDSRAFDVTDERLMGRLATASRLLDELCETAAT